MATLVRWKRKVNKYHDEADGDDFGPRAPKLTNTIQDPEFVMRDEHNAEAMEKLKIKW